MEKLTLNDFQLLAEKVVSQESITEEERLFKSIMQVTIGILNEVGAENFHEVLKEKFPQFFMRKRVSFDLLPGELEQISEGDLYNELFQAQAQIKQLEYFADRGLVYMLTAIKTSSDLSNSYYPVESYQQTKKLLIKKLNNHIQQILEYAGNSSLTSV